MSNVKELKTRIQLKYDSYDNWVIPETVADYAAKRAKAENDKTGPYLKLLAGEIGICEIPATESGASSTVLFKVGNGTDLFKDLPWVSATAADVYDWAKADRVVLDVEEDESGNETGRYIKFMAGDVTVTEIDLSDLATDAELSALDERLAALEDKMSGSAEGGSVEVQLANLDSRLDALEGENGAVKAAETAAKAYTDEREVEINKAIAAAETAAKNAASGALATFAEAQEEIDAAQTEAIEKNAEDIGKEAKAREDADKAINDKLAGIDTTVVAAINAAKEEAIGAAEDAVAGLANDQVAKNAEAIAKNAEDIEAEAKTRKDADDALDTRITKVETFFNAKGEEEGYDGLNKALDTLVEIQDFLTGDGAVADGLIGRVAANEAEIEDLKDVVGFATYEDENGETVKGEGLVADLAAAEESIASLEDTTGTLLDIVDGYTAKGSIKEAIEAAAGAASAAQGTADSAVTAAGTANSRLDTLEKTVADQGTELETTSGLAEDNAEAIADLQEIINGATDSTGLVADVAELQAVVLTNEDTKNEKLRTDITSIQAILNGTDDTAGVVADLASVVTKVEDTSTGLAATKGIADSALELAGDVDERVAAIEEDYLREADEFIINCGTSTAVVHVKAQ